MRIAFVALHFSEYAWNLAQSLATENEVLAIFSRDNCLAELGFVPDMPGNHKLHVRLYRHSLRVFDILSNAGWLARKIKEFSPDVVHYQEDCKDSFMLALPWLRGIPFVLTIHDPLPHTGTDLRARRWNRFGFYTQILRHRCDAAIVHGEYLRKETEALLPRLKERVFSIMHGPLGQSSSSPAFDWEPGNLLLFGRLEAYKGLGHFVAAVQALRDKGLMVKGVVAGRGEDLARHRETLLSDSSFELHEGFIPRDEVARLFRRANIVVLPYTDGTQSGVAAMALGYGRPVVASRVGGIPELVRPGENGILVPPCDVASLGEALEELIVDQKTAQRLATNAYAMSQGALSWDNLAYKHLQVYRWVTENV